MGRIKSKITCSFQTHVRQVLLGKAYLKEAFLNGLYGKSVSFLFGQLVCVVYINLKIFCLSLKEVLLCLAERTAKVVEAPNHQFLSILDPLRSQGPAS